MRHQPRHAPVSVRKRVYPQKPVVRCRDDGLCLAEAAVGSFELVQETGQAPGLIATCCPTRTSRALRPPGTMCIRSPLSGSSTQSSASGSSSPKRRWIAQIPSGVSARTFSPPPSIQRWTAIREGVRVRGCGRFLVRFRIAHNR